MSPDEQRYRTLAAAEDCQAAADRARLAKEMLRPCYILRPEVKRHADGSWWAIYGECVGHGDSAEAAYADFDYEWETGETS